VNILHFCKRMSALKQDFNLRQYNTFNIEVFCKYFTEVSDLNDFLDIIKLSEFRHSEKLILGGGSNILFSKDFDGFVLKNNIKSIQIIAESEDDVYVKVGAGEVWHEFVMWCIERNFAGVENLSLIPGNVGASPMQNIGAYGVEIKDVFHSLEAVNIETGQLKNFSLSECEFGYRESVFKRKLRNQFLITSVTYKLNKKPKFNISYGTISQELERIGVKELSIKAISDAVISIRRSKLPSPNEIGNAGSFFKNPEVTKEFHRELKISYPDIVAHEQASGNIKLAAGWLIEHAGWKGYKHGNAGVHDKQALVLVNHGGAKGKEIFDLSTKIMDSVFSKFGVSLEREVNIY
jgi:UDP-N-acetylmuramate dehydrogenase